MAAAGRSDEALALWQALAASDAAGPALQGAARLFFVMHQIDEGESGELRAMLEPLMAAGNGFRPLAMELNAMLLLRDGERAAAQQIYSEIADDLSEVPRAIIRTLLREGALDFDGDYWPASLRSRAATPSWARGKPIGRCPASGSRSWPSTAA